MAAPRGESEGASVAVGRIRFLIEIERDFGREPERLSKLSFRYRSRLSSLEASPRALPVQNRDVAKTLTSALSVVQVRSAGWRASSGYLAAASAAIPMPQIQTTGPGLLLAQCPSHEPRPLALVHLFFPTPGPGRAFRGNGAEEQPVGAHFGQF